MIIRTDVKIQTEWRPTRYGSGLYKEILDGKSLFKWCCGRRMRRISAYSKSDGKIRHLGLGIPAVVGWYCEVCETRRETAGDFL